MDPFERAEHANAMGYQRWYMDRMFVIAPAGGYVGQLLKVQGVSAATKARQL
jgi:arylsulfatase